MRPQRLTSGPAARREREQCARAVVSALAALATLVLAGTCAARYGAALTRPPDATEGAPAARTAPVGERSSRPLRLAQSGSNPFLSFLEGLFGVQPSNEPRRPRRMEQPRRPPQPTAREMQPPAAFAPPIDRPEPVTTYRTMCVRLCDGYYWPVSFATTQDNFVRDEQACLKSCDHSAALYTYPNPGGQPDEMVSLRGEAYKSLATAFIYRTTYDPGCKCRPHPWEAAAIARHKAYAAQSQPRAVAQGTRQKR
jgi:hypothetical protein